MRCVGGVMNSGKLRSGGERRSVDFYHIIDTCSCPTSKHIDVGKLRRLQS